MCEKINLLRSIFGIFFVCVCVGEYIYSRELEANPRDKTQQRRPTLALHELINYEANYKGY